MSRIAKQPITLPAGVTVVLDRDELKVKGPLGELTKKVSTEVDIAIEGVEVKVSPSHKSITANAMSGTFASHLKNMIEGVTKGFEKKLIIEGVGYRYAVNGNEVKLDIGFSHPVIVPIPAGLKVVTEKNNMTVSGIDKEEVGQFAAKIRSLKKAEPYKGKGIRYIDEVVRRKQGKKASA
ncbi:MAG TPA: 50S ribosomal protein L6 [Candidatus Paceibacterota bacterium]|nr:50S ribosomal protein L6 [Candidatus Paceibacterota bacterium]